ncbi:MAG: prolyl aminopeptidase [Alphaproteobacteria bacterium]|nr:prolyl aminopeptidase [Alphaproteobacteria bacterium]
MPRKHFFPEIRPRKTGMLPLDHGHRMYWEVSGNEKGTPVLFLHGGPGSGTAPDHRRFFRPTRYRIVLFDQRGAGKSTPTASLVANTTRHLIGDIEKLRQHLGIERWLLFGGSWGSTLALAYGQAYPERVLGFILRGVFLGRAEEIDWFLHGMGAFRPEAAQAFRDFLPAAERKAMLVSYLRRLKNADSAIHLPAAAAWCAYERACVALLPAQEPARRRRTASPGELALARIEAHYMRHRMFLKANALLDHLPRIAHLPATIVQGRYDLICPIRTAAELADRWPGATLRVIEQAGHAAQEPGIVEGLIQATEALAGCD